MFLLQKSLDCYLKCNSPMIFVHRTLKMAHRKKYIRCKKETISNITSAQLQVIGTGAPDQPASVLLNTVDKLYLFNCGEGFARFCQDYKFNMTKIDNVFCTQSKWNCIGGLTSLIFVTVAALGFPPTFHGPNNLHKIIQRMIFLSSLGGLFKHRFTEHIFNTNQRFEDDKLIIEPIELQHKQETAVIYVCKLKASRGRFSLKKSVDKNVPVEFLANLVRGEDVTLPDGTVITANEVRHPDFPEKCFMIVDVPNQGFLSALETNEKLNKVLEEMKSCGIEVIVHFTPQNVFNTSRYQNFVQSIDAQRHLLVNDQNKYTSIKKVHLLQQKLHEIDSKVHPLLGTKLNPNPKIYDPNDADSAKYGKLPTLYNKYILRNIPSDDFGETEDVPENQAMIELNAALGVKKDDHSEIYTQSVPKKLVNEEFPRIVFLGTGAADSFTFRNSSGILVHLSKDHSILLDCGTSTCSQINCFYGDEAPEIYRRIKGVFVSHMHLDHHIGLPELFRMRNIYLPADRESLRVFCPLHDLKSWLLFYAKHVDPIQTDIKFIDNEVMLKDNLVNHERSYLNIHSFTTCPVEHFRKSYALSLTFPYQDENERKLFKLAYSGDTGKSKEFIKIGQNADLLIHEATFQRELKAIAEKYHHSTTDLAIEHAIQMQAKYTILTHFSARYHILPYIENELNDTMGIAFDYMEVTPNDFPRLNSLLEKYQKTFPHIEDGLRQKTINYLRRLNEEAFE